MKYNRLLAVRRQVLPLRRAPLHRPHARRRSDDAELLLLPGVIGFWERGRCRTDPVTLRSFADRSGPRRCPPEVRRRQRPDRRAAARVQRGDSCGDSFEADAMTLVLGALRARQMFPRSSRFDTEALRRMGGEDQGDAPRRRGLRRDLRPSLRRADALRGAPGAAVRAAAAVRLRRDATTARPRRGRVRADLDRQRRPCHPTAPRRARWCTGGGTSSSAGASSSTSCPRGSRACPGWRPGTSTDASARCTRPHCPTVVVRRRRRRSRSNSSRGRW